MDKTREIRNLIIAYLRDEISEDELHRLQDWIKAGKNHKLLFEELFDEEKRQKDIREYASFHTSSKWQELKEEINLPPSRKFRLLTFRTVAATAAITLVVAAALIYSQQSPENATPHTEVAQIVPGSPHAILISENGQQIRLGSTEDSCRKIILGTDTLRISEGKSLSYGQTITAGTIEWHTLKIPRGGEFKLTLEDGTEIWLNSETELKYPTHFPENERRIILSGEAYFNVSPNPLKPFIVSTPKMDTKVLGTSFNISAYPDEPKDHTTLVTGSVEIKDKENGQILRLEPGEQALLQDGRLTVQKVDTKLYTLWRMDRFTFSSENLEEVIRKLSRWYNAEFFFANSSLKQKQFTGSLPKYTDIAQVLSIIEMTTNIKFQIKDNTIVIQ